MPLYSIIEPLFKNNASHVKNGMDFLYLIIQSIKHSKNEFCICGDFNNKTTERNELASYWSINKYETMNLSRSGG